MIPKACCDPKDTEDQPSPRKGVATAGKPLPKIYNPSDVEDRTYQMWEESGAFVADRESGKETFTISMPPPNATGQLHLGHACFLSIQDIFTRYARMQDKEALWLPGTDHAAIATENVVIQKLKEEEKITDPRSELGREKLVGRIKEFVESSRGTIRSQIRKMGSSCDWSRERYTMDPALNRCVNEVFVKMYKDGLIYRGMRVVNWDPTLQTTISDDEIIYEDREAMLYTIEYLTSEVTGGDPVYVSTSRPETKLGDSALVVHPDDDRYKHLVGKEFEVTWPRGQTIKVSVIADHTIDPEFGTGVLGLTPYHSKIDYELWQRHKDAIPEQPIQVVDEDGMITGTIKGYEGLTVEQCREELVEELKKEGRLQKEETYVQPLSLSYRSKKPIEPLPKEQWFIDVNKEVVKWKGAKRSLKQVMQETVKSGNITFIPERFEKIYFHWIDNLQDWCISRQIWWGHRIPVWYKEEEGSKDRHVGVQPPEGEGWIQDPDTLDTWFSSALWTWSTLIDPALIDDYSLSLKDLLDKSPDFQHFHPTQVMETGYDIIFFWVARMILMTTYATKDIPFETVYLNGIVRTREGKKMSKSDPKTCIDPLEIIQKYGADALRLSMIVGQSPGNDFRLYEEKIAGYRNFVNKLWNASRFVLMQCEEAKVDPRDMGSGSGILDLGSVPLSLADRALLHALQELIEDVTDGLNNYRLSEVGERLYSFVWDYFCDWYLELSKGELNPDVLVHTLRTIVHLLHPYCPFVTEELWSSIKPKGAGMLMKESWPEANASLKDQEAFNQLQVVIDVIGAIRKMRSEQNIEQGKKVHAIVHTGKYLDLLESQRGHILRLGRLSELTMDATPAKHENAVSTFLKDVEVHLSLEGLIDVEKEKASLEKEQQELSKLVAGLASRLENDEFVGKAPKEVVEKEREKLSNFQEKLSKVEERLASLS